jgi:UDP-N-acetylglucosamine 2-epimerase (non-hydrolysing)
MTGSPATRDRALRLIPGGRDVPGAGVRPTVLHVAAGERNLATLAPLVRALARRDTFRQVVVSAGRGSNGDGEVFRCLGIEVPARHLGIRGGSHAEQTARALRAFERILAKAEPVLVVVAGDQDPALSCALAAAKLGVGVAHMEAGMRSGDWTHPDEINRVLTDRLSDTLLAQSADAAAELVKEGLDPARIHHVGSTIVDTVRTCEARARARRAWERQGASEHGYVLVALRQWPIGRHDERHAAVTAAIGGIACQARVILVTGRRPRGVLEPAGDVERLRAAGVRCLEAQPYIDFLSLEAGAGAIVTDAGEVQEEGSALGVPCHTVCAATERRVTVTHGTNVLIGDERAHVAAVRPSHRPPIPCAIPLWDGRAGERAADVLVAHYALRAASCGLPRVGAG